MYKKGDQYCEVVLFYITCSIKLKTFVVFLFSTAIAKQITEM